jgi:hypothetical protein
LFAYAKVKSGLTPRPVEPWRSYSIRQRATTSDMPVSISVSTTSDVSLSRLGY